MTLRNNYSTSANIISMPIQHNEYAWEHLYDKYGAMMYGIILNLTADAAVAAAIFKQAFVALKKENTLAKRNTNVTLCQTLCQHTYKVTLNYLNINEPKNTKQFNEKYPIIHSFYFEMASLQEVATRGGISEQEVLKKLRVEFLQLRRQ